MAAIRSCSNVHSAWVSSTSFPTYSLIDNLVAPSRLLCPDRLGLGLGFVVERPQKVAAKCLRHLYRPVVFTYDHRAISVGLVRHEG